MNIKITLSVGRNDNIRNKTEYVQDIHYYTTTDEIIHTANFKWVVENTLLFDKVTIRCKVVGSKYIQFIKTAYLSYTARMSHLYFVENLATIILASCLELYSEYEATKKYIEKGCFSE